MCILLDSRVGLGLDMDLWPRKRQNNISGRFGYASDISSGSAYCLVVQVGGRHAG
jgi:hypothetical protein